MARPWLTLLAVALGVALVVGLFGLSVEAGQWYARWLIGH